MQEHWTTFNIPENKDTAEQWLRLLLSCVFWVLIRCIQWQVCEVPIHNYGSWLDCTNEFRCCYRDRPFKFLFLVFIEKHIFEQVLNLSEYGQTRKTDTDIQSSMDTISPLKKRREKRFLHIMHAPMQSYTHTHTQTHPYVHSVCFSSRLSRHIL